MENLSPYSFADITTPPITVVFGVELFPFSLGHWANLEKIDSPFLPGPVQRDISPNDIFLFALICGQTYEDGQEMLNDYSIFIERKNSLEKYVNGNLLFGRHYILNYLASIKVKQFLPFNKLLKKVFRKCLVDPQYRLKKTMFNINQYLEYYMAMPLFDKKDDDGLPSGMPWQQNIYSILQTEYEYGESKIMNMPLNRVFIEWCVHAEKNNAIRLSNKHDIYALKMAKEFKEKK